MQNQWMTTVNGIWRETRSKLDHYGQQLHGVTDGGMEGAQDRLGQIVHNGRDGLGQIVHNSKDGLSKLEQEAQLAWNKGVRASWKVRGQSVDKGDIGEVKKNLKVDNVKLLDRFNSKQPLVGTLYLTATHLIFVDPNGKKETWILHMHIASVEKLSLTTSGSPLLLRCKTFLCVTFVIPKERDCHDVYTSLLKLSQPAHLDDLYAFNYTAPDLKDRSVGWEIFDVQSEYLRQGVPNENWTLSHINQNYELCDTYSRDIFVPQRASTHVLLGSARFRSRGRLPVLSYLHRNNQAAICRCSQPLAGFSARCVEDEQMLQAIRQANPTSKHMLVVDTRPKLNAMVNRAAGKGYENEQFYTNTKFHFLGIENIHVMRSSLNKLLEVCELKNPSYNIFMSGIESSGYLKHLKAILDTAIFVAQAIYEGTSVLVHCSDGWDRTAQVCSLAAFMLDPYYRTIQGFQALIEKEWLSFGHKFTDRCGFISTSEPKDISPVFTQFLDCVWQLMQQFPRSFEFNERFLLTIHEHVYSCQFGTFIGNCEKDRIDLRLRERTYSLWGHLSKMTNDFLHPFYQKEVDIQLPHIIPSAMSHTFKFWRGMYNRFESGLQPRESIMDTVCAVKDHSSSMEEHITLLEKRISTLCRVLGKQDEYFRKLVQGLTASESMDLHALMQQHGHLKTPPDNLNNHPLDNQHNQHGAARRESDSESGFEDYSSQMSKSINDEFALHNSLSHSASVDNLMIDQLVTELRSVAVDWKTFRSVKQCNCAVPFEHHIRKYHCWRCGDVYCTRCIDKVMPLPGHMNPRPVPVCKSCYKELKNSPSPSFQDFQSIASPKTPTAPLIPNNTSEITKSQS